MNVTVQETKDLKPRCLNSACLNSKWTLTATEPGAYTDPSEYQASNPSAIDAIVPGTAAQAYQEANLWSLNNHYDFDSKDWWYQTLFKFNAETDSSLLNFVGLATLCEVWLNGQQILTSQNMFISQQLDVAQHLQEENTLVICFRSLSNNLSQKRPRPRWKTKLINHQQLRWIRTSLLGRIPGWAPPVAPVGPWQPIFLQAKNEPYDFSLKTAVNGQTGLLDFSCRIISKDQIEATLNLKNNDNTLSVTKDASGYTLSGKIEIKNVILWWPHTHGQPHLYTPKLSISINNKKSCFVLPAIGFKNIQINQDNNNFQININGESIFCRGACWTINDIVSLQGAPKKLEQTLTLMRDAGANIIRIGGTMVYEQELFYQLCSKLGLLVWQDFMFANMDYPSNDTDFLSNVKTEITQTITRLRQHACIGIYCGNSEIEQQAAMLGLPENEWQNKLFTQHIPNICTKLHADIPYITSTPSGEVLPFHTNKNITHYYGVGAYQRPVSELRQHDVKFTTECLGFANVPVSKTRNQILSGQLPVAHHPKWKERIPRDTGAGWDFADVRDHYTKNLFNIDPTNMRSFNSESYITLSEITTGEIMSQVFSEWRSNHSQCSGGIVWFLKDFWPGAGWGIIDANGLPKACYYYLKRCWQPLNIGITNETLNGLDIHVTNERLEKFTGNIELLIMNKESIIIAQESINISLSAGSTKTYNSDNILPSFYDITYSYRFGPPKHSLVAVQLKSQNSEIINDCFYFPNAEVPYSNPNTSLTAIAEQLDDDNYQVKITTSHFLYAVNIQIDGFVSIDNFFHMLPNTTKTIKLKKFTPDTNRFKGYISALNLAEDVRVKISA